MRVKLLVFPLMVALLIGSVLFGTAGRVDIPEFWVYIGIWFAAGCFVVLTMDEDLMRERRNPAGESRDNLGLFRCLAFLTIFIYLALAGLERRYGWTTPIPSAVQAAGFAAMIGALVVMVWATRVNRFFSSAVRIQSDRGHVVVTDGPYGFVRHPGYIAFIVLMLAGAVAIGSWFAVIPAFVWASLFVRRAALEDGMLQAELNGYREYAERVRFRLVPHVW